MSVKLGHFELLEQIGKGGMAAVFKAYDPSLNRTVAIKLLDEELAREDPQFVESFIHEAQTAAAINHPNIVQIYFVGEEKGNYYIAMELLEGRSLDEIIKEEGPQSEEAVLKIGVQITDALNAAYANQMVHGDIKPQNIFITNSGDTKLLDFGLAKMANIESSAENDGSVWGSAYYISPERVGHKAEDFRSDIYSLGATLFHAMVGHPPFDADTPEDLAQKRLNEKAPMLRTINPDISVQTEQIIARMLSKSVFLRYLDYNSLSKDMEAAELKIDGKLPVAPLQPQVTGATAFAAKARATAGSIPSAPRLVPRAAPVAVPRPVLTPAPRAGLKSNHKMLILMSGAVAVLLIIMGAILMLHGKHESVVQTAAGDNSQNGASPSVSANTPSGEGLSKDGEKTISLLNLGDIANHCVPNQIPGGGELLANAELTASVVTKDNVRALRFIDRLVLQGNIPTPTSPFSLEVRLAVESIPQGVCGGIYQALGEDKGFRLVLGNNMKLCVDIYHGQDHPKDYLISDAPLEIGRFYDIVVRFDGKHASLFLDGKLNAQIECPLITPYMGNVLIGRASGQSNGIEYLFNGLIQSIRLTVP